MTVSLAAPFLFGLFTKKASTKGAFLSAVLGVAVVMGLRLFNGEWASASSTRQAVGFLWRPLSWP